jgi:hypothetical protein
MFSGLNKLLYKKPREEGMDVDAESQVDQITSDTESHVKDNSTSESSFKRALSSAEDCVMNTKRSRITKPGVVKQSENGVLRIKTVEGDFDHRDDGIGYNFIKNDKVCLVSYFNSLLTPSRFLGAGLVGRRSF